MNRRWLFSVAACLAMAAPALAQQRAIPPAERPAAEAQELRPPARPRLPGASSTQQTLDLPGRQLRFTATAGSIVLSDAQSGPEAEIATIAYTLAGAEPRTRPVTFVLNGGPGFSSAWLQLGAVGPWRVAMGGPGDDRSGIPSASPELLPNAETWLDFTDLVFIDPVGTGYSRFVGNREDVRKRMWSVTGDVDYLAEVMRRWLERSGRVASPKYLLGESYGGFRVPRIARVLTDQQGIGVNGIILVSPQLDTGGRSGALDPMFWSVHLPSMAAAQRAKSGPVTRASLADVEAYATGDYLHDRLAGPRDPAALARLTDRVAELTGIDRELVRRDAGGIPVASFLRETMPGRIASVYDATLTNPAAAPANPFFGEPETTLSRLSAPFSSAMVELYAHRLNWHPETLYQLRNLAAGRSWDYGTGAIRPESATAMRVALAVDPQLQVLVTHGLFDLVTPYFETALILDQFPEIAPAGRIRLMTFEGGHMFYSRDASRIGLRDAAKRLVERE